MKSAHTPVGLALTLSLFCSAFLNAQDTTKVTTTEGQFFSSSAIRKSGNTIFIKVPADKGTGIVELGLPLSRIARVDFPEPSGLKLAVAAATVGDAPDVILQTGSDITTLSDLKDISGSWWPEVARLRLLALCSCGKDAEASTLAQTMGLLNTPEAQSLARGGTLFGPLASSDLEAVIVGASAIPRLSGEQGAALAQLALGRALLLKKDYPGALRAFLTIKVFYPSLTLLQPAALLGAANAYVGMKDQKRALQSAVELQESYPRSFQCSAAKKIEEQLSKP